MPVNKNAQFRYQILDRCFSDFRHKYDFDTLLEKVNDHLEDVQGGDSVISIRQLRGDINAIRKMLPDGIYLDAKPYYDKKCYYRYSERDFSIFQNELTPDEVQKLRSTIEMLSRYRGVPNNAWLEEVISNLEYRFGIKSDSENIVAFEQNEQLKGLEYLSEVIDATVNHIPIVLYYKTYKGKELTSTFHPYHVRQYNNRWFLFGYEEETGKIANKALDRIQRITLANIPFCPTTAIDFAHFFDDVVGVSIPYDGVEKETIILRFKQARFPYVTSKPIHKSQITVNEKECVISLNVKPTRELEQQILSYGSDVEVLSPETFRIQIAENIAEIYKKYFPVQNECTDNVALVIENK